MSIFKKKNPPIILSTLEEKWFYFKIVDHCGGFDFVRAREMFDNDEKYQELEPKIEMIKDWCEEILSSDEELSNNYLKQTIKNIYNMLQ